ncbi:helix-turn-helix transcriptional regulator [candidate division KSB1 bacterium]
MEYSDPLVRAIRILQLLSNKRRITVMELFRLFEKQVSIRTLQRDLNKLSEAGIPLITEKSTGNENVWCLDQRFNNFIPYSVTLNEYLTAHYLKKAVPVFKNTPIEKEYMQLIDKLEQILSSDIFDIIYSSDKSLVTSFVALEYGTYDYSNYKDIINDTIYSINNKKICRFSYKSPDRPKEKTYEMEPYKVLLYNGGLYLVVFNRKYSQFNHFAINRIRKFKVLEDDFVKDQNYEDQQFVKDRYGLSSLPAEEVNIHIHKSVRHHFEGRFWHNTQKMEPQKDGSLILSMKVGISDELIGWILKWCGHLTVIKPESLKRNIIRILDAMKEKYT